MQVWVYGEHKTKPAIIRLPVEERFNCVIKQFIYRMLEIDWWRRPSAAHILKVFSSIFEERTSIWVLNTGSNLVAQPELPEAFPDLGFDGLDEDWLKGEHGPSSIGNQQTSPAEEQVPEQPVEIVHVRRDGNGPQFIQFDTNSKTWRKISWQQCWYTCIEVSAKPLVNVVDGSLT
jgi:hypothetical protein